jgi:integrase
MGRKRTSHKHFPPGFTLKHKAYYVITKAKWVHLGRDYSEALKKYYEIIGEPTIERLNMNYLFDRYMNEVAPTQAKSTYRNAKSYVKPPRAFFGAMIPEEVKPKHIYRYLDIRGKNSVASANKEYNLLSNVFENAIRWGIVEDNPCRNVKKLPEKITRDKLPATELFLIIYNEADVVIKAAMRLSYNTALRLGDLLALNVTNETAQGLHIKASKTSKEQIIAWTPALIEDVQFAKETRLNRASFYYICQPNGRPYSSDSFKTKWQRLVRKLIKSGALTERVQFKDLRAKAGTDIASAKGAEFAQSLLQHSNIATTKKHYIKDGSVKIVQPVK